MAALWLTALTLLVILPGDDLLDHPITVESADELLQYDDGTAYWTTWDGMYRGVWFDLADFGATGCDVDYLEFWFYHGPWYCYDTFSFYAELWSSLDGMPAVELDQTSVAGVHLAPTFSAYDPAIPVEFEFWGVINTEMSCGGWPNNLGDGSPNPVAHSFHSDDFETWEPWIVLGAGMASDYLTRAGVSGMYGLDQSTWGAIKTLF